ncbi:cupin domain-containing protein [Roseomonas terrae]|uniref:Cupin domain-containing protein n=1 Tax=Neoroseomonas terrae TaxID=424799 RepID=A0ABS5EKJ0_9PROT|nr:cupin domain-containing protein [Neoroseomonas terrae]MBR0651518.1 cupin domain-containing protein [Neoroseomonas terrae]
MHEHRLDGAELIFLPDGVTIPNNPRLPVLLHRGAVAPGDPDGAEALFRRHGWLPAWRNGIFDWHHYHSNAHEALAIVTGTVQVQLGGEAGVRVELAAGDVVVLPAGTGHRNLGAEGPLLVVGAYPQGSAPPNQMNEGSEGGDRVRRTIAGTPDPGRDPVSGEAYPLR